MQHAEVAVVGGGPAGLAAALTAVRARRVVVVVDEGAPRNASSPRVHGFLSRDGVTPATLRGAAREQLEPYDRATVLTGRISRITGDVTSGFTLEGTGDPVRAARVVLATGMRDQLPQVPGFADLWGHSVIHCPYCHGWEMAGRRWGIVGYDQPGVARKVELYGNWTDDLILFAGDGVADDVIELSRSAEIAVERRPIVGLHASGRTLSCRAGCRGRAHRGRDAGLAGPATASEVDRRSRTRARCRRICRRRQRPADAPAA